MNSNENNKMDHGVYRFGDCVLDTRRRELRCGSREIELQPRVFDLLAYLVAHRDRAVDKDELQDAVWPGLVVTETALTRAVMKARKAVGDDAGTQRIIRTIHGHGYRFVADLETPDEPTPVLPVPGEKKRSYRATLVVAVLLLAGSLVWKQFIHPPPRPGGIRVAVLPVQNGTGDAELQWTGLGLMGYASSLLGDNSELSAVPDGSVVSLVDGAGWDGSVDGPGFPGLVERFRKVYGATHVLTMQLQQEGTMLRMNYQLQEPGGRPQKGTMVGNEPTELAKGVVQGVYGLLLRKARLDADAPLISVDPFNNEAYARGMAYSLEGRCAEAVPYFRLITEQEPSLFAPRFELAACLRILGEPGEAEEILQQLIEEQQAQGSSAELAKSLMLLGVLYNRTGRLDQAESSHRRALEIARQIDDPELSARIMQNLSIVAKSQSRWDEAREWLDLALLEYQRSGRETLPGHLYSALANLDMERGELAEADANLQKALQAFREAGDRRNEAMMLNNTGYLRRLQGRLDEAEGFHLQSLAIREAIGDRVGVGRIHNMLALLYTSRGQLDLAQASAEQAIAIAQETGDTLFEATSRTRLGEIHGERGDREAARNDYRAARAIFEGINDRMRVLQCNVLLARLDLDDGLAEQARSTALAVVQRARDLDAIQPEIEAMELLGDVAVAQGELQQAAMEYEAALARVRESSWAGEERSLLAKQAGVMMDLGDLEAAAPLVGALSALDEAAESLKVQARYAFLDGDPATAVRRMERAQELAGATWEDGDQEDLEVYRGER